MKVGGRLQQSDLPATSIHPIILHGKSYVVRMMAEALHSRLLHPPLSSLMATVAYSFHIPRLKPLLKSITQNCVVCQRKWAHPVRQRMGDLPAVRCTQSHVFSNVGIDYAGPIHITRGRGRGYTQTKTYVAVFVCMNSRAVHLELAADASTPCFLAALERFCGRRGTPKHIFTDNGSNFHGASAELRRTMETLNTPTAQSDIHRWSAEKGVTWHFQPAYAPNFGGLWEAGVKVMKNLIRKSLHDHHLNAEQLNTILAEAVMNSRPYLPVHSTDEEAFCPLTPGHLLINRPLTALPQQVDENTKISNIRNWNLVKLLSHQHWQHFRKSYLPHLSQKAKDMVAQTNIQPDDVVLVSNQNTSRNYWPLG